MFRNLYVTILAALLLALVPARLVGEENTNAVEPRTEIRFVFAKSMFTGVNENDAQAAMKVYAQTIGDQNGIYVSSAPLLVDGTNEIAQAIGVKRGDLFALTAMEFLALEPLGLEGPPLMSRIRKQATEEYVLLSRADGPLRQATDLKGRSLLVCSDVRSGLAPLWLEVLCREHGLGPATAALDRITYSPKPTQVVLPVFFGKADAGLVTRNSWEVMCELNPQLAKQLRIVAVSPPLVPALTVFLRGTPMALKQQVFRAVELSSTKPSYQQMMALFKCDDVCSQPVSILDSTRVLVARYEQLCNQAAPVTAAGQTAAPIAKEVPPR